MISKIALLRILKRQSVKLYQGLSLVKIKQIALRRWEDVPREEQSKSAEHTYLS